MSTQRTATPSDIANITTFDFPFRTLPDGTTVTFKCRRLDLLTQLLEDVVNAPLMNAALDIIKQVQEWIRETGGSFESAFLQLESNQKNTVMEQLRRFACAAVLEPKFVMGAPANASETSVQALGADTLFALWHYQDTPSLVPRLSEVAATTFRANADVAVTAPVPDGKGVRSTAVDLGATAGTTGHG